MLLEVGDDLSAYCLGKLGFLEVELGIVQIMVKDIGDQGRLLNEDCKVVQQNI